MESRTHVLLTWWHRGSASMLNFPLGWFTGAVQSYDR